MEILLKHKESGQVKVVKLGFSLRGLLAGPFTFLFNGAIGRSILGVVCTFAWYIVILFYMAYTGEMSRRGYDGSALGAIVTGMIIGFHGQNALWYNKIQTQKFINQGFLPTSPDMELYLTAKGITIPKV